MNYVIVIVRILSIQVHKRTSFLYVSGFEKGMQLLIDKDLLDKYQISKMSIIKVRLEKKFNNKGVEIYEVIDVLSIHKPQEKYLPLLESKVNNNSRKIKLFKIQFLNAIGDFFNAQGFRRLISEFSQNERGTSIVSPLELRGQYVKRFVKITHELNLKKNMAYTLQPFYEIGYVARDVYERQNSISEYMILEFVSPLHDEVFLQSSIISIIDIANKLADEIGVPHLDLHDLLVKTLCDTITLEEWHEIKKKAANTIFVNAPVESPLVKCKNGKRTETIWILNGRSLAHGYFDENDYSVISEGCDAQIKTLSLKKIKADVHKDFMGILEVGIPDSISLGFGLDRFLMFYLKFKNMSDYKTFFE